MAIEDRIETVKALLKKLSNYNRIVVENNFEPSTITDIKKNAKSLCDDIKTEVKEIKDEINNWE